MAGASKLLLKGSALRFITLLLNICVGLFMMPFLIHALGDEQYGIWVLVGAVIGFYGLLDLGMGGAMVRFLVRAMHSNEREEVNIALSSAVFLFIGIGLLSLFITITVILMTPFYMEEGLNMTLFQITIAIMGVKASLLFPLSSFRGILMAKYRFDTLSYIQLSSLFLRTFIIVYFVSQGYGIITVAFIMAFDSIFISLVTLYFAKKLAPELRISRSFIKKDKLKKYYHYGKYTYISTIADKIRFSIDDFVVAGFVGLALVTHYAIAVALLNYFNRAMASIFGVIGPVLNKYHKLDQWDNLRDFFIVATELSTISAILFGGLLILLGEPFISIWMGKEYTDIYPAVVILTISGVVAGAQRPSVAIMYAIAKHKYYAKITSIEAIANLALSIVLVQNLGLNGVALGTTIPLLVNKLAFQPIYTCKQLDLSLKDYYSRIGKYFFSSLVIFIPIYIILTLIKIESYIDLVIAGGLITLLYTIINLKFMVSNKTTAYLNGAMPKKLTFLLKSNY